MPRMAEEERVKKAQQWADDYRGARQKMEALARQRFWSDRGVRQDLAWQLAEHLPLTTEQLTREAERFDPVLPTQSLRMLDVAKRLCREHGIRFPVLS